VQAQVEGLAARRRRGVPAAASRLDALHALDDGELRKVALSGPKCQPLANRVGFADRVVRAADVQSAVLRGVTAW
jgi:hypothetical protein